MPYLQITAGAGGTESCDWASMLDAHVPHVRGKARVHDQGTGAYKKATLQGIKTVTIEVEGDYRIWLFERRERRAPARAYFTRLTRMPSAIPVSFRCMFFR